MSYRVYFGRLPEALSQDDFEKLLEKHGKAKNIEWKSGYAYVDYKKGSDAANTVQNLNGKEIEGNNILVELAQNGAGGYSIAGGFSARMKAPLPRPTRTPHRARIENLSSRAKWMELKELLSMAGKVTFADTHKRRQGEGIVEFDKREGLDQAIHMFDKTVFFGKVIRLYDESPTTDKSRSRDESRSRSRSPRRRSTTANQGSKSKHSRSRSHSPVRKKHSSKRTSESRKNTSRSPKRKTHKHKHSRSRSASPLLHKHRRHSKTPPSHSKRTSRNEKRSKRNESRSRSRSPRQIRKHKEKNKLRRSHSSSSSDNNVTSKIKSKTSKRKHSSQSESGSSSSENSESEN